MADTTRAIVALVAGLGAAAVLGSGARASSPPPVRRAARSSPRRKSSAPAPQGVVTMGPLTQVITDAKTGKVTRKTDPTSLTREETDKYINAAIKTGTFEGAEHQLLTDDQATALEDESIERARATMPDAGRAQQELARKAAIKARQQLSPKSVPPIPRTPANPTVSAPPVTKPTSSTPKAYVSPPTPINLELARREAPALAKHIRTKGSSYTRQAVRDFQAHSGITVDGIYGPLTRSALEYFHVPNPPKALFKAKAGTSSVYTPAT